MQEADLLDQATQHFSDLVAAVKPDQWDAPTPDTEWSVRDLVNHLTSEYLWIPPLLAGKTIEEVGDKFDGDVVGEDPAAAWTAAREAALTAIRALDDPTRTVHLSFGDTPAQTYLQQMLIDIVIHGWDLARGIGADDTIPPELLRVTMELFEPQAEDWRSGGSLGPRVPVAADADDQTKLLALSGRKS